MFVLELTLASVCNINLPSGVMNFHRKLLLSEVEVLQLTPLKHLKFRRNRRSSGQLKGKINVLLIKSTKPDLFAECFNLFDTNTHRKQKTGEKKKR